MSFKKNYQLDILKTLGIFVAVAGLDDFIWKIEINNPNKGATAAADSALILAC